MTKSMYRQSFRHRNLAAAFLALMLGCTGVKGVAAWQKIDAYEEAVAKQTAGDVLGAEEAFHRAFSNRALRYKEDEIQAALTALRPAAELQRVLASVEADLQAAAVDPQAFDRLIRAHDAYTAKRDQYAAGGGEVAKLFADTATQHGIDGKLKQAFEQAKQRLLQALGTGAALPAESGQLAITQLARIPAAYFASDKAKAQDISRAAEKYDRARFTAVFKDKAFADALAEGVRAKQFYSERDMQAPWLTNLFEGYAQSQLAKLAGSDDPSAFIAAAKAFQASDSLAAAGSKTMTYIQTAIRKQLAKAAQLAESGKLDAAQALYKALSAFQDTAKEQQALEQRSLAEDPLRLLKQAGADAKFTKTTDVEKKIWGAGYTAAGVSEDGKLTAARLLDSGQAERLDAPLELRGAAVKSLRFVAGWTADKEPLLLVETAAKTRKSRFTAFRFQNGKLDEVLDLEADGLQPERPGVLNADRPAGERAAAAAVFTFKDGAFVFSEAKEDVRDIMLGDLAGHKSETVRFQCYIQVLDDGTVIGQFNDDYVLLEGKFPFKPGSALVTGKYAGEGKVKLDSDSETNSAESANSKAKADEAAKSGRSADATNGSDVKAKPEDAAKAAGKAKSSDKPAVVVPKLTVSAVSQQGAGGAAGGGDKDTKRTGTGTASGSKR